MLYLKINIEYLLITGLILKSSEINGSFTIINLSIVINNIVLILVKPNIPPHTP